MIRISIIFPTVEADDQIKILRERAVSEMRIGALWLHRSDEKEVMASGYLAFIDEHGVS